MREPPYWREDDPNPYWDNHYPWSFVCVQGEGLEGFGAASKLVLEAIEWCVEQFGPSDRLNRETGLWTHYGTHVRFTDMTMAAAFKIRWC